MERVTGTAGDEQIAGVSSMLLEVIRSLVDRPEDVQVKTRARDEGVVFEAEAHVTDRGKLIGRGGRTARALRVILNANATKLHRNLYLDISTRSEENDGQEGF